MPSSTSTQPPPARMSASTKAQSWSRWLNSRASRAASVVVPTPPLAHESVTTFLHGTSVSHNGNCLLCVPPRVRSRAGSITMCEGAYNRCCDDCTPTPTFCALGAACCAREHTAALRSISLPLCLLSLRLTPLCALSDVAAPLICAPCRSRGCFRITVELDLERLFSRVATRGGRTTLRVAACANGSATQPLPNADSSEICVFIAALNVPRALEASHSNHCGRRMSYPHCGSPAMWIISYTN